MQLLDEPTFTAAFLAGLGFVDFALLVVMLIRVWPRVTSRDLMAVRREIIETLRSQPGVTTSPSFLALTAQMREIKVEISGLREAVQRSAAMTRSYSSPPPGTGRPSDAEMHSVSPEPTALASTSGDVVSPERPFLQELVESYNSFPHDDFRRRFSPRPAQLAGKTQLVPHDAGSFWIVGAPTGESYCLPRPGKITPTLHENVGLRNLFLYDGYNPSGPERAFSLDQPARVIPSSDSAWTVGNLGRLRIKAEET